MLIYFNFYLFQLALVMLDIRRGVENLGKLKVSSFVKVWDSEKKIQYWKKVCKNKYLWTLKN